MPSPINPDIEDKEVYLERAEIPLIKKVTNVQFNLLKNSVKANYYRLPIRFESDDVSDGQTLDVGQYVDYGNTHYRVITAHSVNTPKEFQLEKYQVIGSGIVPSSLRSSATSLNINVPERTYVFIGGSDSIWSLPLVSGNSGMRIFVKHRGSDNIVKLTIAKSGSDKLFTVELSESHDMYLGEFKTFICDGIEWQVS